MEWIFKGPKSDYSVCDTKVYYVRTKWDYNLHLHDSSPECKFCAGIYASYSSKFVTISAGSPPNSISTMHFINSQRGQAIYFSKFEFCHGRFLFQIMVVFLVLPHSLCFFFVVVAVWGALRELCSKFLQTGIFSPSFTSASTWTKINDSKDGGWTFPQTSE